MVVRLVLERLRLDPEPRDARRAGGGREELELERGQGPAAGIKLGHVRGGSLFVWAPLIDMSAGERVMFRSDPHSPYYYSWPTRIGFGVSTGAWLAALMWLVLRNAYAGVFVVGLCLGLFMLENWQLHEAVREETERVTELEKQIIVLRGTVGELSLMNSELEAEHRRAAFRARPVRHPSASSL